MTTSISRTIFFVLLGLFVLSLMGLAGQLNSVTALIPNRVVDGLEFWRILTWPLGVEPFSLLIGSICFLTAGEELESFMGRRYFAVMLGMIVALMGLMHLSLFFNDPGPAMIGVTNLALFVMVGYVYLFPQNEIRLIFFSVRTLFLLVAFAAFVLVFTAYAVAHGATPFVFFSVGGFGLCFGTFFFHARYQKYPVLLKPIRGLERLFARKRPVYVQPPRQAERTRPKVVIPVRSGGAPAASKKPAPRRMSDEERLDMILDRIHEKSYNALTEEEKKFLQDYSNKL